MSQIEKRTVSLPKEHADFVAQMVKSGTYASASEVVRAGLRALQERNAAVDRWLMQEVAPSYDALISGDTTPKPSKDLFDGLREHHLKQSKV